MKVRLPPLVQNELDRIPGRWRIEQGKRHKRLVIDGHLIAVIPNKGVVREAPTRDVLNTRAQIRRFLGGRQ